MATRKPRKTASAAKIRVHTDEYGRKVYTVVGTKKFAYTLAKAKEIASKSKKRKSTKSSSSTAMTVRTRKPAKRTTAKRKTTTAKRKPVARKGGAKRNAKGQFVKRGGKKTPVRRTTRRNPTQKQRLDEMLDNRKFFVSVVIDTKVGEVERRVRSRKLSSGKKVISKTILRPVTDEVFNEVKIVRGRHAAIAEAMRLMNVAIGAENARKYFYREDTDTGRDAGNVYFYPKKGTDELFTGRVDVEAVPEDYVLRSAY